MNYSKIISKLRRQILRLLPEFIWPKETKIDDVSIPVRHMPFSYGIKRYLVNNNYENAERYFVNKYLKNGNFVVDMGCSIGVISAIISKKIGLEGKLLSIEASTKIAKETDNWLRNYGFSNVKVLNGFAFPVWKAQNLNAMVFEEGNGSLGSKVVQSDKKTCKPIDNIDLSISKEFLGKFPDVLVCDIEGSETIILDQEPEFPLFLQTIIIELHPMIYGEEVQQRIIEKIENCGYNMIEKKDEVYCFIKKQKL